MPQENASRLSEDHVIAGIAGFRLDQFIFIGDEMLDGIGPIIQFLLLTLDQPDEFGDDIGVEGLSEGVGCEPSLDFGDVGVGCGFDDFVCCDVHLILILS